MSSIFQTINQFRYWSHFNHKSIRFHPIDEFHLFYSSIKSRGSKFIFNLIQSNANKGTPFSHAIFTIIMERIGLVAKKKIHLHYFGSNQSQLLSTNWAAKSMKRKIEILNIKENPKVLVNMLML
ncbi:hypothetical protein H5410_004509 [Solanum commersonii]|uniref:Uncharacterized protein n=1 Tax=Solanum commersonii TaxID=4109 RepID=A0A9J6B7V8_SOLCO|nr:hypothetical protein H5410_004509 [Solanum commersonii]